MSYRYDSYRALPSEEFLIFAVQFRAAAKSRATWHRSRIFKRLSLSGDRRDRLGSVPMVLSMKCIG
jgi:hypothetical protein